MQLDQDVEAQLQVEDDLVLTLEGTHILRFVLHIGGFTQNAQPVLPELAVARVDIGHR